MAISEWPYRGSAALVRRPIGQRASRVRLIPWAGPTAYSGTPMTFPTRDNATSIGWGIYQQVAAVLGSFAFLVFLGNFVDIDWRSLLHELVEAWHDYVRPTVRWVVHIIVEVPLSWFGVQVEVPVLVRDYLAVGFVLIFSVVRVSVAGEGWSAAFRNILLPREGLHVLIWLPFVVLCWPLTLLVFVLETAKSIIDRDMVDFRLGLVVVAPLVYALALVMLNYLLPQ